jgi:aminopeptidase N
MGRVRAALELRQSRSEAAAKALSEAAKKDPFWATRVEATRSLAQFKTDIAKAGLLEAVKDKDSRIRRVAIAGLAGFKDKQLAGLFTGIINSDPSYFAVAEAAKALGQSGAPSAFETLDGLLKQESWRETIRGGALAGLAALKDPRALDLALKYAAPGNNQSLRAAAFPLLAAIGKGNDRALALLTEALKDGSPQLMFNAMQSLAAMGDPRAIPALEELLKNLPAGIPEGAARPLINGVIMQLKNSKKS